MKKLVLASGNPGKLREFRQMLAPLDIDVLSQSDLGIREADEPHATFVENALAKARHASRRAALPAFADDSGICVNALDGAPGVQSARYAAGPPAGPQLNREDQDARNNQKLLAALAGASDRKAHYYCVIALIHRDDDPEPLIAQGRWYGEIIREPRGTNGFGYDPYFLIRELSRTAAELTPQEKNAISHRGRALAQLIAMLREQVAGNE